MSPVKQRTHMSFKQQTFVLNELKKVCKKRGQYSVYDEPFTDESVAQSINLLWSQKPAADPFTFNKRHVEGVRREMIGKHRIIGPKVKEINADPGNLHVFRGDIKAMRARIEVLETQIVQLFGHINAMIDSDDGPIEHGILHHKNDRPGRPHSSPPAPWTPPPR